MICSAHFGYFSANRAGYNVQRVALRKFSSVPLGVGQVINYQQLASILRIGSLSALLKSARKLGAHTGVYLDDAIRPNRIQESLGSPSNCPQEDRLAANLDDTVPDLLWADDHADHRAGTDD